MQKKNNKISTTISKDYATIHDDIVFINTF